MSKKLAEPRRRDGEQGSDDFRAALARAFDEALRDEEKPRPPTLVLQPTDPLDPAVAAAIDEAVARRLPALVDEHLRRLLAETRPLRAAGRTWGRTRPPRP
jgi:hypothetical protein